MYGFGTRMMGHQTTGHGKKATNTLRKGVKWIGESAAPIGSVAGTIGNVAAAALPFTAEIPILGEGVAALAVGGKLIQAGAGQVAKLSGAVKEAQKVKRGLERRGR